MKKIFNKKYLLILIIFLASFLRLWRLDKVPVSLFGDEADVGYQAYSILKTGRDYYGNFMPIHFHSLAEWRTPLYLYSTVPTIALFGITAYGVRLPAAIFGILSIYALYLLIKKVFADEKLALLSAFLMAINPWSIQYSRAGFEVTEMIFLLILGLYFFFCSLQKKGKGLWISVLLLNLTPWVYSTAKLFLPLLYVFLFLTWRKEILSFTKKHLVYAIISFIIIGGPIIYSTLFGGGTQRIGDISVFESENISYEVGQDRVNDANMRGERDSRIKFTLTDKVFHNKFVYSGNEVIKNYLKSFSTEFLFIKGDSNPRHSIGIGEFYKIDCILLLVGLLVFVFGQVNKKIKNLIIFWTLAGALPAALTQNGGDHATRLILILPPLIILISYGLIYGLGKIQKFGKYLTYLYFTVLFISFIFFQHQYWIHNPWWSENWWHYGFKEAIESVKEIDQNYDRIVISTANEPSWVFFAAFYNYSPREWQLNFPIDNVVELENFGRVSHIDRFYFGSPQNGGVYEWGKIMNGKTLYLASATEVPMNLVLEPERTPYDLNLVKTITYPSGKPVFYLFSGK